MIPVGTTEGVKLSLQGLVQPAGGAVEAASAVATHPETTMADPNVPDTGPFAILMTLIGPVISAGIGVMMRHARHAATGKPFSVRRLLIELPSVIGLGIMGGALGDWLGAAEAIRWGLAATLGYLGPQAVEVVFYRWIARQDLP